MLLAHAIDGIVPFEHLLSFSLFFLPAPSAALEFHIQLDDEVKEKLGLCDTEAECKRVGGRPGAAASRRCCAGPL